MNTYKKMFSAFYFPPFFGSINMKAAEKKADGKRK